MKGRLPLFVMLGSAVTFLVSIYLPWMSIQRIGPTAGTSEVGSLLALLVAGLSAAALVRPGLADRLPLGRASLALSCLALSGFITVRHAAQRLLDEERSDPRLAWPYHYSLSFHYVYGAYLALACAIALLVAAAVLRRHELARMREPREAATVLLGVGLLVSLAVLPWRHVSYYESAFPLEGILGALAATAVCAGVATPARRPGERLLWLGSAAVFVAVALDPDRSFPGYPYRYGSWLGVGLIVALIALAAPAAIEARSRWCITRRSVLAAAPAALLLASLFGPWLRMCHPHRLYPSCDTEHGWAFSPATPLGVVAVILIIAVAVPRARLPRAELGVAAAALTATLGVEFSYYVFTRKESLTYGAYAGFAGAALALVVALSEVRVRRVPRRRLLIRLVPIVAAVLCVVPILGPTWGILPEPFLDGYFESNRLGWLLLVFVILAIWLIGAWVRRLPEGAARTGTVVLVPAAMLAVGTLSLVEARHVPWLFPHSARWIALVALPVLLIGLGWVEERGGSTGSQPARTDGNASTTSLATSP